MQAASLSTCLARLAEDCGAEFAALLDASNVLWAHGPVRVSVASKVNSFYRAEVAAHAQELYKGRPLKVHSPEGSARYYAESFASIYIALLWFTVPFSLSNARAYLRNRLPQIKALTLCLPPHGGPGATAAARRLRRP